MNEFNVLLAAATNGTPSGSLFDALFARYIAPQESWRELESPLPITILAAGEDLIDYRIYGNTENGESVGERTESGEPTGYKLPMTVGKNLYNAKNDIPGYYITTFGIITPWDSDYNFISEKIPVLPGNKYTLYYPLTLYGTSITCAFYNDSGNSLSITRIDSITQPYEKIYNLVAPANAAYFQTSIKREPGSESITLFVEHMHDVPIYIGSDPLAEDEYVDFGEQKIYRKVNGILTPADPPVAIPTLPTVEGETIIDYNPSETPAVEPEKMYVKYKPQ